MAALERESATYDARLPDLMKDAGKFVVIKADCIEGVLDTYGDALKLAYDRYPNGGFLVRQISPAPQIAHFSRDLAG